MGCGVSTEGRGGCQACPFRLPLRPAPLPGTGQTLLGCFRRGYLCSKGGHGVHSQPLSLTGPSLHISEHSNLFCFLDLKVLICFVPINICRGIYPKEVVGKNAMGGCRQQETGSHASWLQRRADPGLDSSSGPRLE